jgi:nucleotide-binding universal stress UspA family protein
MFKRILVPLDGSRLAECALPYVEELAKGGGTEQVTLVSVTERVEGYIAGEGSTEPFALSGGGGGFVIQPPAQRFVPKATGKKEKQAEAYLDGIAGGMEAKGIKVRTEVLVGNPAREIVNYAADPGCDIIVMSSHGRSGPSRWAHGSVADKVFKASGVPVLMVRAPGCAPPG